MQGTLPLKLVAAQHRWTLEMKLWQVSSFGSDVQRWWADMVGTGGWLWLRLVMFGYGLSMSVHLIRRLFNSNFCRFLLFVIIWSVEMKGQRLRSQELSQSISTTTYFYVFSVLQGMVTAHKWGTEPCTISLENVSLTCRNLDSDTKLESVSNLHFSKVWVQSQKLIKVKVGKPISKLQFMF